MNLHPKLAEKRRKTCALIIKGIAEKVDEIEYFYVPYVSLLALRLLVIRSSAWFAMMTIDWRFPAFLLTVVPFSIPPPHLLNRLRN